MSTPSLRPDFLYPDHTLAGAFSSIIAPRLSALHILMSRRTSAAFGDISASSLSALLISGAKANPVGPHELWPIPVAPARARACSRAPTARLLNREPP